MFRYVISGAVCFFCLSAPAWAVDCPDKDEDGYTAQDCGGEDCNDSDPNINPMATDVPNDGIDQNCDGVDFTQNCDQDEDGYTSLACGGDDCNDLDPNVHVGADDPDGDGIDQDCSGDVTCEPTVWVQGHRTCDVTQAAAMVWLPVGLLVLVRRRGVRA